MNGKALLPKNKKIPYGWTEVNILAKCAVCGERAVFFVHGKWWCEKHHDRADKHLEKVESPSSEEEKEIGINLDFGLKKLYKSKTSSRKLGLK